MTHQSPVGDSLRDLTDTGTSSGTKTCFFDGEARLADFFEDNPDRIQGGTFLLASPTLTVTRTRIQPGFKVAPHHHGTHQVTYVIKGQLKYGNRVVTAGMGVFTPGSKYSWVAGPEGADLLEIFDGIPMKAVRS